MRPLSILVILIFVMSLFISCGGSDTPKAAPKKGDRSGSDWSASGQVKEIEEMQKAGEKKTAPADAAKPAPAPAETKK